MSKKRVVLVGGLLCFLLPIGLFSVIFDFPLVKVSAAVYIQADGSISPSTAPIASFDNITYTVTGNVNDSLVVEKDNIVLDGAYYAIQGTGISDSKGIELLARNNVTIKNFAVRDFYYGIYVDSSSINVIQRNNVTNNEYGIYMSFSSDNLLESNNLATNNQYGIYIFWSSGNRLRDNIMTNNLYNFGVLGGHSSLKYYNDVDISNTVDGKPVYYWVNEHDGTIPVDAGCVVLVGCSHVNVQHLNLTSTYSGILLVSTINSTVSNNTITKTLYGISFESSSNNLLSLNTIGNNGLGVYLYLSSNNRIVGNNITANVGRGIALEYSSNNILSRNTLRNNSYGIYFLLSTKNQVVGNNITLNSSFGVYFSSSSDNRIFHNNLNNTRQVYSYDSADILDNGYPSGGNRWSNYTDVDVKSGPNQDVSGSDGIGDTPYVVNVNNRDTYPLMRTWLPIPPNTTSNYNGSWHNSDFTIQLSATDYDMSGIYETYYKINNGPTETVKNDGQPLITTEGVNSTVEFWSVDNSGTEEALHNTLTEIKLDETPPIANAGSNQTVNAGNTVSFDGSASTDNIGIVAYQWNFGDGATGEGKTATHVYATSGTYTVTLTVKDAAGNSGTKSASVNVLQGETRSQQAIDPFLVLAVGAIAAVAVAVAAAYWMKRRHKATPKS